MAGCRRLRHETLVIAAVRLVTTVGGDRKKRRKNGTEVAITPTRGRYIFNYFIYNLIQVNDRVQIIIYPVLVTLYL